MATAGISKIIAWQYRLTRTEGGLKIEVLDYHAEPVVLTPETLGELGLVFTDPPAGRPATQKRRGQRGRELAEPDEVM